MADVNVCRSEGCGFEEVCNRGKEDGVAETVRSSRSESDFDYRSKGNLRAVLGVMIFQWKGFELQPHVPSLLSCVIII